jgi:membrane protein CcdC involved in cytochrome C biogenesis
MYKKIRDITVAFVVWFVLAYIITATSFSFLLWESNFNIYEWDVYSRTSYAVVWVMIGVLVKSMEK